MKVLMRTLAARLQRLSPSAITAIGLCSALALGLPDSVTPGPMSFVLFHLLVVVFVGWGAGKWHAVAVSGVAVATMATVQWCMHRNTLPPGWVFVWNNSMRFLVLSIAGWLTAEVTRLTHHLGQLVEDRTAQWKAEVEQHKATSMHLAEAIDRFEQVINNITEVFWLTDVAKNQMAYISPGYERVWGRKCEELYREPRSWAAAIHPADRDEVFRRAQSDQATGNYDVEYRILRPDGGVRWIRDRAFPVRNKQGEVYRVAGLAEDITERKRTREVLKTQAAILENMAEGVVVIDETGVIVQMNPAGERIWGYARGDVFGQPASKFSALSEPEATAVMHEVLAALEATGSWRGTFNNRRKDGSIICCEAVISRLELEGQVLMVAVEQDVTERLRAQDQLQIQARVLECMAEAVMMVDEHGAILLTNPALDALLGYERGELTGESMLLVSGYSAEQFRREFDRSLDQVKARGSAASEYVARRKDGTLIEVAAQTSGVSIGDRFCLVVVGQDITQRKRAEQALRQSEESLRVFLDAVPEPAFLLDREGRILLANRALAQSLDRPEIELVTQYAFGLIPAALAKSRKAMFDRVVHTRNPVHYEDARAGRHFMNFGTPVLDSAGNVSRVAMFALDITKRKEVESALARQEAFYRTLFELSPDGILLEDVKGNILDVNQAICRSFGCTREELLRQNVRRFAPPDCQGEVEAHLATLQAGQTLEHEVWNVRKNGDRCLMRLNEKPLALPDGGEGILVVARDITQSKRAELTKEAFLSLGAKLSATRTPVEAARAVYAAADQLWKWDAATLDLYSLKRDWMEPVLFCDVIDGQRREVAPAHAAGSPPPRASQIMREGAELILRQPADMQGTQFVRFGDTSRLSASLMCVALRREGQPIGILSIQSYTHDAYTQEDLRTLQALADHCAGALERLRAEQALQQREELNRAMLATAMDGIFVIDFSADPRGAITEVNDAYCHLVGYSPEELRHMRIADLEATESPEEVTRHKARILAAGADRFETRHRRKDGQEIQVEISVSMLAGSTERVFGFVRDISERKRAELAKEAFLTLGSKLSVARTATEAGKAIFASADLLWDWHCGTLDLCLPEGGGAQPVLNYDVVEGQRREVPGRLETGEPSPRMRRIAKQGPELILRKPLGQPEEGSQMIGDTARPSQSIMCVPLRREGLAIGVLSIQSYTPNAYTREDLLTLQALADHCEGALQRIQAEAALLEEHDKLEQRVQERTSELRTANALLQDVYGHLELRVHERTAELQAANAALGESEERYRSLVNNLNVGIFRTTPGPHGRIMQANPAAAHIHGYDSVEEFQKVSVADLYQEPSERNAFVSDLLRQDAVVNYEVRLKKMDGTPIYGRINATVHRGPSGDVGWIDGMLEDITERKKAEQSLAEALELNRTLISASTVGIAAYKASGQCVIANEKLAGITGGTSEQLLQQDFRRLKSWHTDGLLAKAEAALETGQPQVLEARSRTTFGRELMISARFSSFTSQGEQHLLIMVTDETEAHRAQAALRASEERYRALAESSPDAIFILDRDIKVQYVNSTAAALWGRKPEQLLGLKQPDLFPPETAEYHEAVVKQVFKTGKPMRRDEPLTFPTGEQWIEIRLAPLYGEQGTVTSVMGVCRDITERKRAERQLAEALDLNQKMIAASVIGITAFKASGECVFANEALARTIGGSVSEVLQGNFRRLKSWQKSGLLRLAEEALNQGQVRSGEVFTTTRFGKSVWLGCHTAPFVSNGQPHLLLMALDISERKRAEEALKLQSLVVQNMAEGALLVGPDQTILFANTALETSFGYEPGELIGQSVAVLNAGSAEDTARLNAEVIHVTEHGAAWSGEYQNRRKNGTLFTSEARVRALDLGGRRHYVSVQQDITERKRVEGALKQAERLQRAILDNIPDPAWLKDAEGRFLACNKAIARFYGLPVESFLGKTFLECVPKEAARSAREDKEVMTTRRSVVIEAPLTDAQGRARWLESIKSPLFNERDEVVGTVGIARDITERRQLEHQVLEISDREQARIGQDIHDGLCQQLVSLAFDANALQRDLSAQSRSEASIALRLADYLDQAITEARQVSRGLFPVRLGTEGLGAALLELANNTKARSKIGCRFAGRKSVVVEPLATATHLYRIAREAVNNAVRHSQASTVCIRLRDQANQIELSVEDDGAGLSPAKRKDATGLGLHIMDYRARAVGGTLRIGSGPRGGTIVSCCVPRPKS